MMEILFIILGVLFLIFLPIINIYFPIVGSWIPTSINKDYDLNPNKRKVRESKDKYYKSLQDLNAIPEPVFSFKSFCKAFIIVLIMLIVFVSILFNS